MKDARTGSQVTTVPAADPWVAAQHFGDRLAFETDCADVWGVIEGGTMDFLIADCRSAATYEKTHIPGAISPLEGDHSRTGGGHARPPDRDLLLGAIVQRATKGANHLAALGPEVKEMIGGIEYWIREGHLTEGKARRRSREGPAVGLGARGVIDQQGPCDRR
jgi:rhodanese-related sulfurtransferase